MKNVKKIIISKYTLIIIAVKCLKGEKILNSNKNLKHIKNTPKKWKYIINIILLTFQSIITNINNPMVTKKSNQLNTLVKVKWFKGSYINVKISENNKIISKIKKKHIDIILLPILKINNV